MNTTMTLDKEQQKIDAKVRRRDAVSSLLMSDSKHNEIKLAGPSTTKA